MKPERKRRVVLLVAEGRTTGEKTGGGSFVMVGRREEEWDLAQSK